MLCRRAAVGLVLPADLLDDPQALGADGPYGGQGPRVAAEEQAQLLHGVDLFPAQGQGYLPQLRLLRGESGLTACEIVLYHRISSCCPGGGIPGFAPGSGIRSRGTF